MVSNIGDNGYLNNLDIFFTTYENASPFANTEPNPNPAILTEAIPDLVRLGTHSYNLRTHTQKNNCVGLISRVPFHKHKIDKNIHVLCL